MPYSPSRSRHLYKQSVLTTDATVTTLKSFPVKNNSSAYLVAYVTAMRTGGSAGTLNDAAVYHIENGVKNNQGTAVQLGAVSVVNQAEDQTGWACTFDVSGGYIRLRVTGAANNNITWNAEILVTENA